MPIDAAKYQQMKKQAEADQREADRAAGALEQTKAKLKEMGIKSLREGDEEVARLDAEIKETEEGFNTAYRELEALRAGSKPA